MFGRRESKEKRNCVFKCILAKKYFMELNNKCGLLLAYLTLLSAVYIYNMMILDGLDLL